MKTIAQLALDLKKVQKAKKDIKEALESRGVQSSGKLKNFPNEIDLLRCGKLSNKELRFTNSTFSKIPDPILNEIKTYSKLDYTFENCTSLKQVELNRLTATEMYYTFTSCTGIEKIVIRDCDCLQKIQTIMGYITNDVMPKDVYIHNCTKLTSIESLRIKNSLVIENCPNINNLSYAFAYSRFDKYALPNFPQLNTLSGTFYNCKNLTNVTFNGQYPNVTTMCQAFMGCSNLTSVDLSHFPNVHDFAGTFHACTTINVTELFNYVNQNYTNIDGNCMFLACNVHELNIPHTNAFTSMSAMFMDNVNNTALNMTVTNNCTNIQSVARNQNSLRCANVYFDLKSGVSQVDVYGAFSYCTNLSRLTLSSDHNVTLEAPGLLHLCSKLEYLSVSENVCFSNIGYMLCDCSVITSCNLSINTMDLRYAFSGCKNLELFSENNTLRCINHTQSHQGCDACNAFYNCEKLKNVKFILDDNCAYADIAGAFYCCKNITSITLPRLIFDFVHSNVSYTFHNCVNLQTLSVDQIDVNLPWYAYTGIVYLSSCTKLSTESLLMVLNALPNVSVTLSMVFGTTNLNKLTTEQKAIAASKGWTLT